MLLGPREVPALLWRYGNSKTNGSSLFPSRNPAPIYNGQKDDLSFYPKKSKKRKKKKKNKKKQCTRYLYVIPQVLFSRSSWFGPKQDVIWRLNLHAYAHNWPCQTRYNRRIAIGFALTDDGGSKRRAEFQVTDGMAQQAMIRYQGKKIEADHGCEYVSAPMAIQSLIISIVRYFGPPNHDAK